MTKETDKMKAIKQQQNKMRIFLTIITLLIANGLWAQKNNSYSPKFKKGQSAVYEFTLEQTQSGTPDSIIQCSTSVLLQKMIITFSVE